MLKHLFIQNFAIISELNVELSNGLNIVTGETGAGKSIMLDALGLVLGQRADKGVLTNKDKKCVVEALFDISQLPLAPFFEERSLDYEKETILRREISPTGRSRAFINDSPCKLEDLAHLSEYLIEVHQQFDQLSIREEYFQRSILDVLAEHQEKVRKFSSSFDAWQADMRRLERLRNNLSDLIKERDFLQFQFTELEDAAIEKGEDETLSDELLLLSQSGEISAQLNTASHTISEGDHNFLDLLRHMIQGLSNFNTNKQIESISERLHAVLAELSDISAEMLDLKDGLEHNPLRIDEIESRLAVFFNLRQKHGVGTADELIDVAQRIEEKLSTLVENEGDIILLEQKVAEEEQRLQKLAGEISKTRKSAIPSLEKKVVMKLIELGMPNAKFEVGISEKTMDRSGQDEVVFLFSSNKGMEPSPIKLTASGGEISRLNLAIKSEVAGKLQLPTMIFDEIDAGVSGEIARRIGRLLVSLGKEHQIVCITHTPQIASLGSHHLHVNKDSSGDLTETKIQILGKEERVDVIGQMLGGDPPSSEAMKAAKALIMAD